MSDSETSETTAVPEREMAERHEWIGEYGLPVKVSIIPGEQSVYPIAFFLDGDPRDPEDFGPLELAAELLRIVAERDAALAEVAELERIVKEVKDHRDYVIDQWEAESTVRKGVLAGMINDERRWLEQISELRAALMLSPCLCEGSFKCSRCKALDLESDQATKAGQPEGAQP